MLGDWSSIYFDTANNANVVTWSDHDKGGTVVLQVTARLDTRVTATDGKA